MCPSSCGIVRFKLEDYVILTNLHVLKLNHLISEFDQKCFRILLLITLNGIEINFGDRLGLNFLDSRPKLS